MKKTPFYKTTSCLLFTLLAFSCAIPIEKPVITEEALEIGASLYILREKALDSENMGKFYTAMQLWKSLYYFNPEDSEAIQKITELNTLIHAKADEHFKKGLAYHQHKSNRDARKAFLLTIYYNPEHQEALDYLKNKFPGDDYVLYETRQGDTLDSIAEEFYKDTGKDFLVAYYNDLESDEELNPGIVLKLPTLDFPEPEEPARSQVKMTAEMPQKKEGPTQPVSENTLTEPPTTQTEIMQELQTSSEKTLPDLKTPLEEIPQDSKQMAAITSNYDIETAQKKNRLDEAIKLFESKKYNESVLVAETILEQDAENIDATEIVNASYYQMGKASSKTKNYEKAIKYYSLVDPEYKDVKRLKTGIEVKLAENHYLQGVKYFLKEEIVKAIHEWDITVALNPDHTKAKSDMEQAKKILKRVEEIK